MLCTVTVVNCVVVMLVAGGCTGGAHTVTCSILGFESAAVFWLVGANWVVLALIDITVKVQV
jgi:hypothetical protein